MLSIRFASGEVRLRAVDGTAVRVRDRSDHDIAGMFEIDRADGSLSLHIEHGRGWFTAKGHTPELDVEVPRRAAVVIESASGDIAGEGLAGDQRYRTTSGDVLLRRCAGRIVAEAVSGDIDVVAAAEINLSARTVSGDVAVRAGTLRGLRASTTSGDLKVAGRFSSRRVRGRDGQWRRAGRASRRRHDRDDHRHRRPSLRRRGTHRGRPRPSIGGHRLAWAGV